MKNKDFEIADGVLKKYHGNSESVAVPYGVRKIGDEAFKGVASLKKLVMPETVEGIGDFAFEGCAYLESVVIAEYKRNFFQRLSDKFKKKEEYDDLPYSARTVGVRAFANCVSLLNVDLPAGVNKLCKETFCGCTGLQIIVLPNDIEEIEENAFFMCKNLKNVKISKGIVKIGKAAFAETALKEINIPDSIKYVDLGAFPKNIEYTGISYEEIILKNALVEGEVKRKAKKKSEEEKKLRKESEQKNEVGEDDRFVIEGNTLKKYTGIKSNVKIPDNVYEIGESAFNQCATIKHVLFTDNLKSIGSKAFFNCINLSEIVLPYSVENIAKLAFSGCRSIRKLEIKADNIKIGDRAFSNCLALREVSISANSADIGKSAFLMCNNLGIVNITCVNKLEIRDRAFPECVRMKNLTVNGEHVDTGREIVPPIIQKKEENASNTQKKKTDTMAEVKSDDGSKAQNKTQTQTEVRYRKYTPENKKSMHKDVDKAVNAYSNRSNDKNISSIGKGMNMSVKQQKPEKKKITAEVRKCRKEFLEQVERISTGNLIVSQYGDNLMPGLFKGEEHTGASYDEGSGKAVLRVEVMGTGYEGRTPRIETLSAGNRVEIVREPENEYNSNNLAVRNTNGESLGNLSAEIGNCLSPLIDAGAATVTSAKVSLVKTRADKGKRARKADLYVEFEVKLEKFEFDDGGCVVLLLGGDQVNVWAQKLTVLHCDIPIKDAKLLFEAENRLHGQYEDADPDDDLSYVGLEGLEKEIIDAREKRKGNMIRGKDYSAPAESAPEEDHYIQNFMLKLAKQDPKRYGVLKEYSEDLRKHIGVEKGEEWREYWSADVSDIFREHEIDSRTYYWLDRTRVSIDVYDREATGFYHWYNVMELYESEKDIPFDLNDEDIACIFGFNKFVDFADLSYGC